MDGGTSAERELEVNWKRWRLNRLNDKLHLQIETKL